MAATIGNNKNQEWTVEKALDLYNVLNWGAGYFNVNQAGHLTCCPYGVPGPSIDFLDVIDEIKVKNLNFPCIVRFQDILRSRVATLIRTFNEQITEHAYTGRYFGVYPIKVNQMREVVEEILDAGSHGHVGLEAGSKAELLTVLAYNTDPQALTICNGYKDADYLRLALMGQKLGRNVIIVIEKISELPQLLSIASEMGIEPVIGLRAKLSTPGAGKWISSSGDFAKFGLTTPEIIQAVDLLKSQNKQHILKLFHFHAGSQLTDIRSIKEAINEGGRIFAKLVKMGFPIEYFDVGGGLGVDYEGSSTTSESSMNYSMEEYVADVVYNVQQICKHEKIAEPNLVSESGRAITAHHSCLIIPVFGNIQIGQDISDLLNAQNNSEIVEKMGEIVRQLTPKKMLETFHDATAAKEEAMSMFKLGILSLEDRAKVESLYWHVCRQITVMTAGKKRVHKDTSHLEKAMADQYLANFSLFQSAPDHWAFGQLFPLVPLHRLDERPLQASTLVDITCDSDGKIDRFINAQAPQSVLPLHALKPGEPYYLGLFMLGAYQDIMGDMHNLFGRVNEVHVFCDDEDPTDFYIEEDIAGDRVADVIQRLQYYPSELIKLVKKTMDEKIKSGAVKPKEGITLVEFYEKLLYSYTYLSTSPTNINKAEQMVAPVSEGAGTLTTAI